jgi:hypothetical protein
MAVGVEEGDEFIYPAQSSREVNLSFMGGIECSIFSAFDYVDNLV